MELFLRCPQLYAHNYLGPQGSEGIKRGAKGLGSLIHQGLAQHYARLREEQARRDPEKYADPIGSVMATANTETKEGQKQRDTACFVLEDYFKRYEKDRWRVVEVEDLAAIDYNIPKADLDRLGPIRAPVRMNGGWLRDSEGNLVVLENTSVTMTARVDLGVEDERGRYFIIDHKTTGRLLAHHPKMYGTSGQMMNYSWIGTVNRNNFGGVLLNMIEATPDEPKFRRYPPDFADTLLHRFPSIVVEAERRIAALELETAQGLRQVDQWPAAANELTCLTRYGFCAHYSKCRGE